MNCMIAKGHEVIAGDRKPNVNLLINCYLYEWSLRLHASCTLSHGYQGLAHTNYHKGILTLR